MKIVVRSALDVALWFNDRAFGDGEYLQPQKLHRLMYLAQAYYTVAYPKHKLMPASFVTDEFGPTEPTVFHALAYGFPPNLEAHSIPKTAAEFLESIWRRFGASKAEHLNQTAAHSRTRGRRHGQGHWAGNSLRHHGCILRFRNCRPKRRDAGR